jgi:hypothetical protein
MRSLFRRACARARAREFVDTLSPRSRGCHRAREHSRTPERSHAAFTPPLVCQKCSARQLGARSSKLAPAATVRPHRECPLCSAAAHRALRTKRGLPRTHRGNSLSFKAGALNLARIARFAGLSLRASLARISTRSMSVSDRILTSSSVRMKVGRGTRRDSFNFG